MSYTYLFVIFYITFQRMVHPDLWPLKVSTTSDLQHWHERMGSAHSACQLEAESVGNVAKLSQVWWDDMMIWCGMSQVWLEDMMIWCGMRQVWWGDGSSYKPEECYQWPPNVCMSARINALAMALALPPPQLAPALCPSSYFHLWRCLETVFLINVIKIQ